MGFDSLFQKTGTTTKSSTGFGSLFDNLDGTALAQRHKIAQYEYEDLLAKANSEYENRLSTVTKRTIGGAAKSLFVDIPKAVAKGTVEFILSGGESIPRLMTWGSKGLPDYSNAEYDPIKLPLVGEVESFQNRAIREKREGASNAGAIGMGVLDTVLNAPTLVAFKPLLRLVGLDAKTIARLNPRIGGAKNADEVKAVFKEEQIPIADDVVDEVMGNLPKTVDAVAETAKPASFKELFDVPETPMQQARPLPVDGVEQVVNSRAEKLMQAAIERQLIDEVGDIPSHSRLNMARLAKESNDFVASSREDTLKVLRGEALPPPNVTPQSIYTAAEIRAVKNGDMEMIDALRRSNIPTITGQALKALDSTDMNSPVKIMRDIDRARAAKIQTKSGESVSSLKVREVKEMQKEIATSVKAGRPTWDDFIKEITCGY